MISSDKTLTADHGTWGRKCSTGKDKPNSLVKWNDRNDTDFPPTVFTGCVTVSWHHSAWSQGSDAIRAEAVLSPRCLTPSFCHQTFLDKPYQAEVAWSTLHSSCLQGPRLPHWQECSWDIGRLLWNPYLIYNAYSQEKLAQNGSELRNQVKLHNFTQVGVICWSMCFELEIGEERENN